MRVQLELDESFADIVNQIKTAAGSPKMKYSEFFDVAIGFLNWGVKQIEEGRIIASVDENADTYTQITMPLFDRIQQKRKKSIPPTPFPPPPQSTPPPPPL